MRGARRAVLPDAGRTWWPWAGLCLAAALGALAAQALDPARLNWQPALAGSEPWRAITAAWVHLSPLHLAGNLAGTAVVAAWAWPPAAGSAPPWPGRWPGR